MFSQQEMWQTMERNCYCCRPGLAPFLSPLGPQAVGSPLMQPPPPLSTMVPQPRARPKVESMDMDLALTELDDLRSATSSLRSKSSSSGTGADGRQDRKLRVRSLSESMLTASVSSRGRDGCPGDGWCVPKSGCEVLGGRVSQLRKMCSVGSGGVGRVAGCSLSLPRKVGVGMGVYHMVSRNAAFVSDISAPARSWTPTDSGFGSFSEQSSDPSPPLAPGLAMGVYRDSDVLEERSRQRRLARVRLDRSRRFRQPYSIPFRMYQSMNEDATASLTDFLTATSPATGPAPGPAPTLGGSKSTSSSPVKDAEGGAAWGLVRSRSIDNLELARLRLTDSLDSKVATQNDLDIDNGEVEQVASDLKNLQMV